MVRLRVPRIVLAASAAALLSACALVMGFDDYDTSQAPTVVQTDAKTTSVHGTIDGLEGDAVVHIRVNGGDEVVRPNGTFSVERSLTPGRAFRIDAKSDGYTCNANPDGGPAAPDGDLEANVHCASQNARLATLSFVDGVLEPTFDPGTLGYRLSAPLLRILQGIDGSAKPQSESATIAVGPGFVPGLRGAAAPLSFSDAGMTVRVSPAAGAASDYVVDRRIRSALFKAVAPEPGAGFGWSVAVSGDVLAVGAIYEGRLDGGVEAGACHVFRRAGAVWREEAVLTPSVYAANAQYGTSVAVRGDVLAVGAPNATIDGGAHGAVFVYRHDATGWVEESALTAAGNYFGASVALADDVLAVGAHSEDVSGAAYVYRHVGSAWNVEARVTPNPPTTDSVGFGRTLAITADRLVVGAPYETGRTGAAYVFAHTGTSWAFEQRLAPYPVGQQQAQFGFSTAIEDDVIAVGADMDGSTAAGIDADAAPDPSAFAVGAAFVFRRTNGVWAKEAYLKASNAQTQTHFGYSVALAQGALVVGSPYETSRATGIDGTPTDDGTQVGAAYVFRRSGNAWLQRAYVKPAFVHDSDHFGWSVGADRTTLAVGVKGESSSARGVIMDPDASPSGGDNVGAAYVY